MTSNFLLSNRCPPLTKIECVDCVEITTVMRMMNSLAQTCIIILTAKSGSQPMLFQMTNVHQDQSEIILELRNFPKVRVNKNFKISTATFVLEYFLKFCKK